MAKRENLDPDVNLWHTIAVELHRQREAHAETLQSLGDVLGVDRSTVARYESGEVPLPVAKARVLDERWALEGLFENLVKIAKRDTAPINWWETFKTLELEARVIKVYEPSVIPALLQREGYARGLFTLGRQDGIEDAVTERLGRQAVLTRLDTPPDYFVILDPAALYRRVGGREIMADQLGHLLVLAALPNVHLRIVSQELEAYDGVGGSIMVLHTPDGPAALGRYGLSGMVLTDPSDVQRQEVEFDLIGASSLTTAASRQLISDTLDAL